MRCPVLRCGSAADRYNKGPTVRAVKPNNGRLQGGGSGGQVAVEEEEAPRGRTGGGRAVSYTHLRAHETEADL
eukprot:1000350-Rhodomonas_salina.1